ncbi:MAG: DUF4830 domain-containing protein [Clostridia bacterium]|nr:DUF4830 domain-containing protein [Clostridia bacterium]
MYFTFTKKTLICILCILLFGLFVFSRYDETAVKLQKNGDTHKKRCDFLSNIGCEIHEETATEKDITIPTEFGDVYNNYNELQNSVGYNLKNYKGEKCKIYSYDVKKFAPLKKNDYAKANLIVYNGRIIGGDISSSKINGKMYPLKKYEKTKT